MKSKKSDFTWVKDIEDLIKSPDFCKTITACQELLEEINSLIPSSQMKFLKLNLSLAVDILIVCQKQIYRLIQRHRGWFT